MENKLIHGVGYSVSVLSRDLYFIQEAGQLLNESGFIYEDFVKAGLEEYDLKEIRKVFEIELKQDIKQKEAEVKG